MEQKRMMSHDASFVKKQTLLHNDNVCLVWIILRSELDEGVLENTEVDKLDTWDVMTLGGENDDLD